MTESFDASAPSDATLLAEIARARAVDTLARMFLDRLGGIVPTEADASTALADVRAVGSEYDATPAEMRHFILARVGQLEVGTD